MVKFTATDKLGQTTTYTFQMSTATYTIYRMAGGNGVAFGQAATKRGVEVAPDWPFYSHGKEIQKLILDIAHPVGTVLESVSQTFDPNAAWPWSYWGVIPSANYATFATDVTVWLRIY